MARRQLPAGVEYQLKFKDEYHERNPCAVRSYITFAHFFYRSSQCQ